MYSINIIFYLFGYFTRWTFVVFRSSRFTCIFILEPEKAVRWLSSFRITPSHTYLNVSSTPYACQGEEICLALVRLALPSPADDLSNASSINAWASSMQQNGNMDGEKLHTTKIIHRTIRSRMFAVIPVQSQILLVYLLVFLHFTIKIVIIYQIDNL